MPPQVRIKGQTRPEDPVRVGGGAMALASQMGRMNLEEEKKEAAASNFMGVSGQAAAAQQRT